MYKVSVGDGICSVVYVNNDTIACKPPGKKPGSGAESKPRVQVTWVLIPR